MKKKITADDLNNSLKVSGYLESIGSSKTKRGRPATHRPDESAKTRGCKEGTGRVTYIVRKDLQTKTKATAFHTGQSISDVVNKALEDYLTAQEKKYGKLILPKYANND